MTEYKLNLDIPRSSEDISHIGICGGYTAITTNVKDALNNFDRVTDTLGHRISELENSSKDDGSTAINEFNSDEIKHTDSRGNETNIKDELERLHNHINKLESIIVNPYMGSKSGFKIFQGNKKQYITEYPCKLESTGDYDKDLVKLISLRYDIDNYLALKIKLHSGTTQTCIISEKFGSKIHKVLNDEFGRPLTAEGVNSRASIVDNFRQRCKFLER